MAKHTDKSLATQGSTDADVEMYFLQHYPIVYCFVCFIKFATIPMAAVAALYSHAFVTADDWIARLSGIRRPLDLSQHRETHNKTGHSESSPLYFIPLRMYGHFTRTIPRRNRIGLPTPDC